MSESVVVEIVRVLDGTWPGYVECQLIDVAGRAWLFHDKVPIFTIAEIDANSVLPQPAGIRCRVIERRVRSDGRESAIIDTELPDHVEATTGETRFEVLASQVSSETTPK